MAELDGLTGAECLVLDPLDAETPRPLWELAKQFIDAVVGDKPDAQNIADLLAAAQASLVRHGLVEVRRFTYWPNGLPVPADRVAIDSREVLAVHIT